MSQGIQGASICPKEARQRQDAAKIEVAPASELPYRLVANRTGVVLGAFKLREEALTFRKTMPFEKLVPPKRTKKNSAARGR